MNIAIIGAGLIGEKRASALSLNVKLCNVCDIDIDKAMLLAKKYSCSFSSKWKEIVNNPSINAIIVSTTNNLLSTIASSAIKKGKHVLVEKPGAKNLAEFNKIVKAYNHHPVVFMVGYNHRYHPSIQMAKNIVDSKKFGDILFIRAVYGHGGRLGYEKEWRFNPKIAGGGELLDQGSHLIDLVNYFAGPMDQTIGFVGNLFWKSPLEDAGFIILRNKKGQLAHLSATAVEWKNIFNFEIMLKNAKIQINGLGRSYGCETLTLYKMKKEMGPPDMEEFNFNQNDNSWRKENEDFFLRIKRKDFSNPSIQDAKYVLETVNKIYSQNKRRKI